MPRSPKKKAGKAFQESTPAGGGYMGFFSLQSGTVMSSCVLFMLALTSFFYNITAPNPTESSGAYTCQYVVAYLFFVVVFVGVVVVSIAAFKFKTKWVLIGACILSGAAVFWFIVSFLSFLTATGVVQYLCIHNRCPPTVWIFEVTWRSTATGSGGGGAGDGDVSPTSESSNDVTAETMQDGATPDTQAPPNMAFAEVHPLPEGSFQFDRWKNTRERPKRLSGGLFGDEVNNLNFQLHQDDGKDRNDYRYLSWSRLAPIKRLYNRRPVNFMSSYVSSTPPPGEIDDTVGMSIFCFMALTLFWVYSLWSMFSYHKELKLQDKEDEEARIAEVEEQPA